MAKVLVSESNLINIANAIRAKNGSNNEYTPGQMAAAIQAISTGSSSLWTINITQSAHQTISVAASISKSGNSSYTIGPNDIPNVIATVIPDEGYTAGFASVQQSETTFNVSATAATVTTYTVTITQSANQTITVICNGTSHTASFTAPYGASWTASIAADNGYTAGTLSASSGTITGPVMISATAATSQGSGGGDSSSFTKTYNNVAATISNNGENFSMSGFGSYSDGWWVPSSIQISRYYNNMPITNSNNSSNAVYTYTGTLTLDGYELNFSAVNSSGFVNFTDNSNLSAFKTYYQSLGDGDHTFTTVVLTLTNISVKYEVEYGFSRSINSSAMPNTIYYSSVVNNANNQLDSTVPNDEYLDDGATTTVWTPAPPSSTVLTDSTNNCKWTFSGYSPTSVGGDTINGQGIDYYINYTWVATPLS